MGRQFPDVFQLAQIGIEPILALFNEMSTDALSRSGCGT